MRLPDFIVIGAAKAGTTTLYRNLVRHPAIFMTTPKEPEFFARDEHYAKGIEEYATLFAEAGPGQLCGEASTLYTLSPFFPTTAERMAEHLPDVKLIYMMREPVRRSYSYYTQMVKNYQNATGDLSVNRRFEEFIHPNRYPIRAPREKAFGWFSSHLPDDPELFLAGSDYLLQVQAYLKHFDRAQMHFLTLESYTADPIHEMKRLCTFLGVDPSEFSDDLVTANVSADHFETTAAVKKIKKLSRLAGPLYPVARSLPEGMKDWLKRRLGKSGGTNYAPPPMLDDTQTALARRFAENRTALAELTGLDLSDW